MAEYIHFVPIEKKTKTFVWSCRNNSSLEELGQVRWYAPWRQYCFFPTRRVDVVFNNVCLMDIRNFISAAMDARKEF